MTLILTLIVLGLALVVLELFLPGGICGIIGGILLFIANIIIFNTYGFLPGLWSLLALVIIVFITAILAIKILGKTKTGQQLIHTADASDWRAYNPANQNLVGKSGTTRTTLRPCGSAVIDGQRLDVLTRGEMIPANASITVTAVEGNQIFVAEQTAGIPLQKA